MKTLLLAALLLLAGCAGSGFEPGFLNNNPGAAEGIRMIGQAGQQQQAPMPQTRSGVLIPLGQGWYSYQGN